MDRRKLGDRGRWTSRSSDTRQGNGVRWEVRVDWSSRSLPVVDRSFIRWTRGYRWTQDMKVRETRGQWWVKVRSTSPAHAVDLRVASGVKTRGK